MSCCQVAVIVRLLCAALSSFLPCLQLSLYAHENTPRWAYAFQAVQMKIVFFVQKETIWVKCVLQGSTYEKAWPFFFFSVIFCLFRFLFFVFFLFFLGIYVFSLNNIVRRHTTLTSLHREKIMWKAERQRKFKNISLHSRIHIQRRAKSIWWRLYITLDYKLLFLIKVSNFFGFVCFLNLFIYFFVFVWSSNVIVGHIHYVYLKCAWTVKFPFPSI